MVLGGFLLILVFLIWGFGILCLCGSGQDIVQHCIVFVMLLECL